ncbi:hypothetical protein [Sphingomonas sp.]|uniref:hypothetical protein n=1 Tax=Sphingomonas sp. TaxID=28214 RepID=UPI00286E5528|nr:hypothetical protein [Sphingomonas sp.]
MKFRNLLGVAAAASLAVSGCSSRPRAFAPMLAAPPTEQSAFDAAYAECSQLLVAGKLDDSGRLASAAGGAAASGAALAAGGATAAAVAGYAGLAVVAATVVLLPFAAVGGAVGMAKMKRAKKEKAIKAKMSGCLAERGFVVASWAKMSKADIAKAEAAAKAGAAPQAD